MISLDPPWWVIVLAVLALTFPAGLAGAAALTVWRARRTLDGIGWALLGYLLASGLSTVTAMTVTGSSGPDRTIDSDVLFWASVPVAVALLAVAAWGLVRRRDHWSDAPVR